MHFGEHITIDGYGGSEKLLDDRAVVLSCLAELPPQLNVKPLGKPEIYRAEAGKGKDPGGWTGIVVIAESHISVHTFPKRGFVSADVYTCHNGMNSGFIVDYFKKKFALADVETNFLKRGTKYPTANIYP